MAILSVAWFVGCQAVAEVEPEIKIVLTDSERIVSSVAEVTGYDATDIFALGSALINTLLGANQVWMGKRESKLGKIIRGVEANPDTPSVISQLADVMDLAAKDYKVIKKILKQENVS